MKQMTIDEIKVMYPGLEALVDNSGVVVGYPQPGDLFNVQGSGTNVDDAWQDAWEFLTHTGSYSNEMQDFMLCKLSMDKTPDGTPFLHIHEQHSDTVLAAIQISDEAATRVSTNVKIRIKEFPY